jgi:hypothetical protein
VHSLQFATDSVARSLNQQAKLLTTPTRCAFAACVQQPFHPFVLCCACRQQPLKCLRAGLGCGDTGKLNPRPCQQRYLSAIYSIYSCTNAQAAYHLAAKPEHPKTTGLFSTATHQHVWRSAAASNVRHKQLARVWFPRQLLQKRPKSKGACSLVSPCYLLSFCSTDDPC